jgi:hypothetical protein
MESHKTSIGLDQRATRRNNGSDTYDDDEVDNDDDDASEIDYHMVQYQLTYRRSLNNRVKILLGEKN